MKFIKKRFDQDLMTIVKRYQGRIDVNMIDYYCCWMQKRDNVHTGSRKRSRGSIKNNKKNIFYD